MNEPIELVEAIEAAEQGHSPIIPPTQLEPDRPKKQFIRDIYQPHLPGKDDINFTEVQNRIVDNLNHTKAQSNYKYVKELQLLEQTGYRMEYYQDFICAIKDPRTLNQPWFKE